MSAPAITTVIVDDPTAWVKAQLGDNNPQARLHSDDHIDEVLAVYPAAPVLALGQLAHELVVRYAQKPDSVRLPNGLSVSYRERIDAWRALATAYLAYLQTQAGTGSTGAVRPAAGYIAAGRDWRPS